MKHDPYFKYLAAAIIAGVLLALFDPTPTLEAPTATVATLAASR